MYDCIIVEDEPYALDALIAYLQALHGFRIVKAYADPLLALAEITAGPIVDFIFMDIDMPVMSGIDLADAIKNKTRNLIFSTGFKQYSYQAYQTDAKAYLLKPYSLSKLALTINRVLKGDQDLIAEPYFLVKSREDLKVKKIKYRDIYAVESDKNYVRIHLANHFITAYISLAEILKLLAFHPEFLQLHRSFVIALHHIELIDGHLIALDNGLKFSVGLKFRKQFAEFVARHMIHAETMRKEV